MAHARVAQSEIVGRASQVFRSVGYEAATFSRLAEATGVEKASLYYHFPRGKEQIVEAVGSQIGLWLEENLLQPSRDETVPLERRLRIMMRRLREFYKDGTLPCIMDTLSLPDTPEALRVALRSSLEAWIDAFALMARQGGHGRATAARRAERALMQIEGGLVLSRVLHSPRPFRRAVAALPALLLKSSGPG